MALRYNPPPGWNVPLNESGHPVDDFVPDAEWPAAPADWQFWVLEEEIILEADKSDPDEDNKAPEPEIEHIEFEATSGELNDTSELSEDLIVLQDEILLQRAGIYDYHHPLENSPQYENELDALRTQIKQVLKAGDAVVSSDAFSFEGSLAKGKRLVTDLAALCLRAFNSEVDISMRTMRAGSLSVAKQRLEKSRSAIEKLGAQMGLRVSDAYFDLRLKEIELVSDLLHKKAEEKAAEREERERLREEARVRRELEQQRADLEKEKDHLSAVLEALIREGRTDEAAVIQDSIGKVDEAIADNDFRAANVRAGYVYVISNLGSFGPDVVKIGLTRRLEPEDRIKELSDASVPFVFDKHLIYFSEDAVALEQKLHDVFRDRSVNVANQRKEFFFATPEEVKSEMEKMVGTLLEFISKPNAEEYFQSRGMWPEQFRQR